MAGGDVFSPVRYKNLDLRDPKLTRRDRAPTAGQLVARLSAEALAFFVTLEADRPGRFSDQRRRRSFPATTPRSPSPPPTATPAGITLTARDLHSSFTR